MLRAAGGRRAAATWVRVGDGKGSPETPEVSSVQGSASRVGTQTGNDLRFQPHAGQPLRVSLH